MRCEKCGKKLRPGEMFCSVCGYYNSKADSDSEDWEMEEDEEESFDDNLLDYEENDEEDRNDLDDSFDDLVKVKEEPEEIEEFSLKADASGTKDHEFYYENEDLLERFIGEDYKLIKKSPFNIYAFLLNWMYVLYRKMYIFGIIGLTITGAVFLLSKKYFLIYAIVVMVLLGLLFNKIYIALGKGKVERYIRKNPEMDHFDLERLMEKKGGVNIPKALIIYGIFLVVIILNLFTIHYFKDSVSKYFSTNSQNQATCTSILKSAYKDYLKDEKLGTVQEGTCKMINSTDFDVYMKTEKEGKTYYIYFFASNGRFEKKLTTENYDDLLLKQTNNAITKEEATELKEIKNAISSYESIRKNATEEDEKIENHKDTEEKKYFVITKEEITR